MKTKLFRKIVQTHSRASLIVQTWRATSLLLLLLLPCGCTKYEDNAIWDRLNSQDARIAALEERQATVNRDIVALQTIVTALRNYDYITGVTPFDDPAPGGHHVTFTKSGQITIWNGSKGDDGEDGEKGDPGADGDTGSPGADAPQIGVAQYPDDSGVYYWTLDGEWLLDGNEDKIPVTGDKGDTGEDGRPGTPGATPKVAIGTDGNWYVSPDGSGTGTPPGDGWNDTGVPATGDTGATGAQGDAIFAKDGIDYDDDDYVTFTLADGTTTIQVPKYRPLSISFTPPTEFELGQVKYIDYTITGNVQTITAVDVPRGWTVTPNTASSIIAVTAPASDGKYYTAAGTVTLLASDGAERTITAPLALSCTAYVPPAAPAITFTQPDIFNNSETKDIPFTLTGNATNVKVLDVPKDWTVAITLSGAAGTFTVTSPSDVTTRLSDVAPIFVYGDDGTVKVRQLELPGGFKAASAQTWTFGESPLVWSDRIIVPECNKDDFTASDTDPHCRSYDDNGTLRYYYNWPYVQSNAATLCPAPWRVPTRTEFENLGYDAAAIWTQWGQGGYADGSGMQKTDFMGWYWVLPWEWDTYAPAYLFSPLDPQTPLDDQRLGGQFRCVK